MNTPTVTPLITTSGRTNGNGNGNGKDDKNDNANNNFSASQDNMLPIVKLGLKDQPRKRPLSFLRKQFSTEKRVEVYGQQDEFEDLRSFCTRSRSNCACKKYLTILKMSSGSKNNETRNLIPSQNDPSVDSRDSAESTSSRFSFTVDNALLGPKEELQIRKSPWMLIKSLNKAQAFTFICAWLGYILGSFDFAILTFTLPYIAEEFETKVSVVTSSITIGLYLRPIGAIIFSVAAEKLGRKWPLMINILLFSIMELASGLAPNFTIFFITRAIFGIAMGGEWGLSATLAMESLPQDCRGLFSGILQQGYPLGALLAAALYYLTIERLGWRAMFLIGSLPALLVVVIRFWVPESKVWEQQRDNRLLTGTSWFSEIKYLIKNQWPRFLYGIILMGAYNFTRGFYDLYVTFLKAQLGYNPRQILLISMFSTSGAIIGSTVVGYLSQYWGRRFMIIISAIMVALFIPLTSIPTLSISVIALGNFFLHFFTEGHWAILPAHLSELAPPTVRSIYVCLVPHLGGLLGAYSALLEAFLAEQVPLPDGTPNYALIQSIILTIGLILLIVITALGKEAKDANFEEQVLIENFDQDNDTKLYDIEDDPSGRNNSLEI
ncbi:hypothetical protein G9A89_016948 [Geosiphon pyriformis]|nr:hypothetical protein G9A89_016948 [Geosiphon pyriformis]